MNIQEILSKDTRVVELKQKYQELVQKKNYFIIQISNVEADIMKCMGSYETIAKEVLAAATTTPIPAEPEPIDPGPEAPIVPENEDNGFADAQALTPTDIPVTSENTNPPSDINFYEGSPE